MKTGREEGVSVVRAIVRIFYSKQFGFGLLD